MGRLGGRGRGGWWEGRGGIVRGLGRGYVVSGVMDFIYLLAHKELTKLV